MKKAKHVLFQTKTHTKKLATSLPNLEQLDQIASTKLKAEEILQLTSRIAEYRIKLKELEMGVTALLKLRNSLEKLDRDDKDPIALEDIDEQIKLFKREIHIYESRIRKIQDKIQSIITKDVIKSERYEKEMPKLKLQKRETNQEIQKIKCAIDRLQETLNRFKYLNTLFEDVIRDKDIYQQNQLLEKEKLKHESRLQQIEAEIKALVKQETSHPVFLPPNPARQLFFISKIEKNNPIKEAVVKNLTL
jgi:type I site-specific restriction-modification system R (restriction) subunit